MATVRRSNFDWNGQPYWGLVQQNGSWTSTPGDMKRNNIIGGGIGVGGTKHAGHANFAAIINPYQINATGPPPSPSGYAQPTVMMGAVDMKRSTKMGKAKTKLTLAARTPLQTGHKMGGAKEDIFPPEAGDILPPVIVEGTSRFGSTHHIMEMPSLIAESDYDTASVGSSPREDGTTSVGSSPREDGTIILQPAPAGRNREPKNVHILPYEPIYPTLPSPSVPVDQLFASTINRDFERQAVMARQIEFIDSNYKEAELFTVPGKEMRATRQGPLFGPARAPERINRTPKRITNRPPRINAIPSTLKFGFKGRPGDGENLIGARYGTADNLKNSAPKRFDEIPDVTENGPPAQNTRTRRRRRELANVVPRQQMVRDF